MSKGETTHSSLAKILVPEVQIRRSIVVESKLSAIVRVYEQILVELRNYRFDTDDIFAIHLALDEAFVNAVKHGNDMDPTKKVEVEYSVDSDKMAVTLTDEGGGFVSVSVADPCQGEGLSKSTGRGLLLMNSYMDIVEFNEPGNSVYMVKYKGKPGRRSE
jgi:serine/threonine-protein kinase RsbW